MFTVSELQSIIANGSRNITRMELTHLALIDCAKDYKNVGDQAYATEYYNKAYKLRADISRAAQHQKKFKLILKSMMEPKPKKLRVPKPDDRFYTDKFTPRVYKFTPKVNKVPEQMDSTMKQTNPKDAIGSSKLPIHLWPNTATAMGCIGMLNGMLKYGRSNFRSSGIRASIYVDAAKRHIDAWFEGEEVDPDDGVPHLSAALACLAIIVDAKAAGKLTDDRMVEGGYRDIVTELTPHVERLKKLHSGKSPKHFTIADNS